VSVGLLYRYLTARRGEARRRAQAGFRAIPLCASPVRTDIRTEEFTPAGPIAAGRGPHEQGAGTPLDGEHECNAMPALPLAGAT
jgi:hypothetical protein